MIADNDPENIREHGDMLDPVETLVDAIVECSDIDFEQLKDRFEDQVEANYEEREFARSFDVLHKLYHRWMDSA